MNTDNRVRTVGGGEAEEDIGGSGDGQRLDLGW